ncbi:MAG: hypothetical protein HY791_35400 [Deltaproteobacteria bacterium]|nr:hypothetical protein [Deltaproteobacteria bacterium]
MSEETERLHTGVRMTADHDLAASFQRVCDGGFDFAVLDLAPEGEDGYSDRDLGAATWRSFIVGRGTATTEPALEKQLAWSRHLGLPVVIAPPPFEPIADYGRALMAHLLEPASTAPVWVPVAWDETSWTNWDRIRTICDYDPRLVLCLEVTHKVPGPDELARWLAEPVECLAVEAELLLRAGADVREAMGRFFTKLARSGLVLARTDASLIEARKALDTLFSASWGALSTDGQTSARYAGQLITAAQPLRDHLDSQTYEHFELGTEKYTRYLAAIRAALRDLALEDAHVVVAGAGRGPLVEATLAAAKELDKRVRLFAIEKNPNAAVTLRQRIRGEWGDQVRFFEGDMRAFVPERPIDLLVSELLGGFGDNELSPECLEPMERHLAPHAIVLPSYYQSWLAPVFAPTLFSAASREGTRSERPVVSTLGRSHLLAAPKPCFEFMHPRPDRDLKGLDSDRQAKLEFLPMSTSVLHGFAGFFESDLYAGHRISILPGRETAGSSWAPLYFPLERAIRLRRLEPIELHFFRRASRTHVWYEWLVEQPEITRLHNPGGRTEAMAR